jgi:DNA polymerase V
MSDRQEPSPTLTLGALLSGEVSCGLFGLMDDFIEDQLSLDQKFLARRTTTFLVRAGGVSMTPEIKPGDLLVVDRSLPLSSGKIATFYVNGQALCKLYVLEQGRPVLRSFNMEYKDIFLRSEDDWQLFGVVTAVIRELR